MLLIGVIANIREGGNVKDIELVREMVKSYISRPSCLILLVVSCESERLLHFPFDNDQ